VHAADQGGQYRRRLPRQIPDGTDVAALHMAPSRVRVNGCHNGLTTSLAAQLVV
jgi:hypothetical protein